MRNKAKNFIDDALDQLNSHRPFEDDDPELMHCDADRVLRDLLRNLGCGEVVDVYEEMSEHFMYV
jgi:hypothetical protein